MILFQKCVDKVGYAFLTVKSKNKTMKKTLTKRMAVVAALAIVILSFASCAREGCPGMITKQNPQPAQEKCM